MNTVDFITDIDFDQKERTILHNGVMINRLLAGNPKILAAIFTENSIEELYFSYIELFHSNRDEAIKILASQGIGPHNDAVVFSFSDISEETLTDVEIWWRNLKISIPLKVFMTWRESITQHSLILLQLTVDKFVEACTCLFAASNWSEIDSTSREYLRQYINRQLGHSDQDRLTVYQDICELSRIKEKYISTQSSETAIFE